MSGEMPATEIRTEGLSDVYYALRGRLTTGEVVWSGHVETAPGVTSQEETPEKAIESVRRFMERRASAEHTE